MAADVQLAPPGERKFGRYRTVEVLGSGAMGTVYRASDEVLGRDVAVKTIRLGMGGSFRDDVFRQRFLNEARAVAALSHPNIVQLFDTGVEGEEPYLVMEVVSGRSLRERLALDGTLPAAEVRALGIQMARALEAAHTRGVIHRDVKPANILEAGAGLFKLTDFGVARVPTSDLTIDGQFLGTPTYAAPESLEEGKFSPASDLYGLAATLYEALTGEPPFGRHGLATLSRERAVVPPSAKRPGAPMDLDPIILRALARDPADRPSATRFAEGLAGGSGAMAVAFAETVTASVPMAAAAPPPAAAASVSQRYPRGMIASAIGLTALFGIGIGIGVGSEGEKDGTSGPASPAPSAPMTGNMRPQEGTVPVADPSSPRSGKQEERWNKAQRKLQEGDFKKAEKELIKLLEADPYDREAEALLQYVHELRERDEGEYRRHEE